MLPSLTCPALQSHRLLGADALCPVLCARCRGNLLSQQMPKTLGCCCAWSPLAHRGGRNKAAPWAGSSDAYYEEHT